MQTLQPSIKNGRSVWNAEALPKEEFQGRVRRFAGGYGGEGIGSGLCLWQGIQWERRPVLSDQPPSAYGTGVQAVAVPREGEPVVFFEGALRGLPTYKRMIWVEDVRGGQRYWGYVRQVPGRKPGESLWGWWDPAADAVQEIPGLA